jgi:hypothetical protein
MTDNNAPSLTMNNSVCVHNTQAFYKSTAADYLKIGARSNNYYDETFVGFDPSAGTEFDPQLDGFKLWGLADAPQLWTEKGGHRLSINKLPPPAGSLTVPLDFKTSYNGEVVLEFSGMESFDPSLPIRLRDHLSGSLTDLRQQPVYSFIHDSLNSEQRFSLVFGYPEGIGNSGTNDGRIWISGRSLWINPGDLAGSEAEVEIFNLLGQRLWSAKIRLDRITSITPDLEGMVIVRLTASGRSSTTRGYLR